MYERRQTKQINTSTRITNMKYLPINQLSQIKISITDYKQIRIIIT